MIIPEVLKRGVIIGDFGKNVLKFRNDQLIDRLSNRSRKYYRSILRIVVDFYVKSPENHDERIDKV